MMHCRILSQTDFIMLCLLMLKLGQCEVSFLIHEFRYDCAVNIEDLIKLSDVMTEHSLGPNGGEPTLLFLPSR